MTTTEREVFCNLLYVVFAECHAEDADTVRIKTEIPELKMQLIAKINFDMEDMEEKEK